MNNLVNGQDKSVMMNIKKERYFTEQSENMLNLGNGTVSAINISICNEISAIAVLAILSSNVIHIEVVFNAYINEFEVKVFDVSSVYLTSRRRRFGFNVYLENKGAFEQLKALKEKLIDFITEAKEAAMSGSNKSEKKY